MLADRSTGLRLSEMAAQVGLDVRMAHSLVAVRKSRGYLGLATMHDRDRPGLNPLQLGAIYICSWAPSTSSSSIPRGRAARAAKRRILPGCRKEPARSLGVWTAPV
jgi:hypothetical protein